MDNTEMTNPESETRPFEDSGECSDEVVFGFNDGKKLYVSQNFLIYASPVFKAMFHEEFTEKESKEILMTQEYSDFLELLLSLHPGLQKPIDNSNVLRVVPLAEEYKIKPLIRESKDCMIKWLSSEVDTAVNVKINKNMVKHARPCLTILIKAISLGYEDVVAHAVGVLARFPHEVFTGSLKVSNPVQKPLFSFGTSKAHGKTTLNILGTKKTGVVKEEANSYFGTSLIGLRSECPVEECMKLFESLSDKMKTRLLLQRLELCDDGLMR